MRLQGFIGPAYTLDDVEVDYQRAVNLFAEAIESQTGKGAQVGYYKSTPGLDEILDASTILSNTFASSDVNTGTDQINQTTHGLVNNLPGQLTTDGTLPTGLSLATDYYIQYEDADNYGFYDAKAGSLVDITAVGSGNHTFTQNAVSGPIRLVYYDGYGRTFVVSEDIVYKITYSSGWVLTTIGVLFTSSGVVKAANGNLNEVTLFVDGANTYLFWDNGSEYFDELSTFAYTVPTNPTDITWADGYFIVTVKDTGSFQVSDLNSPNFNALSFASSEGNPDNVVGVIANNRDIWMLNETTTEVYVNTGNADFPFERIQGGFIETGCASLASISKISGVLFWLGKDNNGQGIVYTASGLVPQRISTHAIERAISGYADLSTSTAYTYQSNGHGFYVLSFAEATWVYDLATSLWHERAYTNAGTLERHRANFCAFEPNQGVQILGDYASTKIYIYNDSTYDDNGDAITRLRITPHISSENLRIFCSRLWLDIKTGVGLASGQGSDPQVMLDWSDDGGNTWSDEAWTSAGGQSGGIGEYSTRVFWNRLGAFRDRIFRFKVTDPVPVTLIDATLEVKHGRN